MNARPQIWRRQITRHGFEVAHMTARPSVTVAAHPCHRRANRSPLVARLVMLAALAAACVGLVALRALL